MSYIIFCKGKRAEKPLVIEDLKLRLYSVEELCYYIYSNVSLCDRELMDRGLPAWIEGRCGLPDLAESLRIVMQKDPRPERIAAQIFAYTDFLNRQEREAVCERIRKYSQLGFYERRKMRADYFFLDGKYREAIWDYEDMLRTKSYDHQKMKHSLMYNVGCCYAGLYYYDIAYGWFLRAADMDISKGEDILAALFCKKMTCDKEQWSRYLEEHPEFQGYAPVMEKQLQTEESNWIMTDEAKKLENLKKHEGGRDKDYYMMLDNVLNEWKRKA